MDLVNPIVQRLCREASDDPERFWDRAARQLSWFRTWDRAFEWEPPTFRWFVGGRTNLAYNCVDWQVMQGRGAQAALIYVNERGERRGVTHAQPPGEVGRIAAGLRGGGDWQGDRNNHH